MRIHPLAALILLAGSLAAQQRDAAGQRIKGMVMHWPPPFPVELLIAGAEADDDFDGRRFYFLVDEGEQAQARAQFEAAGVDLDRVRFLATFGTVAPEPVPPKGPVRMVAEWEPALGAIVSWPLEVPDSVLVEIARDDILFLLVKPEHESAARGHVQGLGIARERVELIPSDVDSAYPRDFGPHQIFDGEGRLAVLDTMFSGWPRYSAEPAKDDLAWSSLWFEGPGDEDAGIDFARHRGLPVYRVPAFLTGGNFLVDGAGTAFCTRALVDENREHLDPGQLSGLVESYAGIDNFVVLENTEGQGIQHIDCWLKVLDRGRLLVKRPPSGHPEAERIERNLELIARTPTASGRPWEVLRIDTPALGAPGWGGEAPLAAYTNSLVLNGKVLVPLFGIDGDEAALATWEKVLPGHRVVGIPHDEWRHFDALHCRVRAVFDPGMLRILHHPLVGASAGAPVRVEAELDARSGAELVTQGLAVFHRAVGARSWERTALEQVDGRRYAAVLPGYEGGVEVEYYLRASDRSGRQETHPRTGPAGTHRFSVR